MAREFVYSKSAACSMDPNTVEAAQYLARLSRTIGKLDARAIDNVADALFDAFRAGTTVFIVGNGGSAALASHFACDLAKGVSFNNGRSRMRVLSLTDNIPLLTAWANDVGYECIFAEQLRNFIAAGDMVVAISGSGNSGNVLRALELAKASGATTIGITGFQGGKMKALCDVCVVIPSDNMQIIEDLHTVAAHAVATILRNKIADAQRAQLAEAA